MPKFSKSSLTRLSSCHPDLIALFKEVVKTWDCTIVCGHRGEEAQDIAYNTNRSQVKFPNSKHNVFPSSAVDVAPYYAGVGIDWEDKIGFAYFAGYVQATAQRMGIRLRWGGDFNGDLRGRGQSFVDMPHWELILK